MSITANDERGLVARGFLVPWPKALADAWMDYTSMKLMFSIKFANGVLFQGNQKAAVINEARTYAEVTRRLTGKFP